MLLGAFGVRETRREEGDAHAERQRDDRGGAERQAVGQPERQLGGKGVVELHMTAHAATMAFDPTTLTVPAGSTVHLALENEKPGALPHNWALVNPGTEAKVAADGLKKGEEGNYMADSPDILAHTDPVKPGATGDVTFKAPAAGKYPFICTYPGHYIMMKGVLTVTP